MDANLTSLDGTQHASQHALLQGSFTNSFIIPSSQLDDPIPDDPNMHLPRSSIMHYASNKHEQFEDGLGQASLRLTHNSQQALNSQMLNDSQFVRDMGNLENQSALNLTQHHGSFSVPAINFVLPSGPIDPSMMSLLSMMAAGGSQQQRIEINHTLLSPLPAPHPSLLKPEHKDSKAIRRGPMDEMRQLLRILVKLFPQAPLNTSSADIDGVGTAGGGNRLSERQIREFLEFLGDAPEPEWGLPEGWGTFISDLFSWATGKVITRDQAAACARRKQGKSWEVLHHELAKLGVYCWTWPVPLTIEGIKEANEAASVENQDLGLKNPLRGSLKVSLPGQRRATPSARVGPHPLPGGREEEAGDELGIARLLGEMRHSQTIDGDMGGLCGGMIMEPLSRPETLVQQAKRHKNLLGGVTVSPDSDAPHIHGPGDTHLFDLGLAILTSAPNASGGRKADVDSFDIASLSPIECWDLAARCIGNAGSSQGGSDALEIGDRIRAIGTTIQAIGLEARSALSDLLPEIPKGYHDILVSLKTLEEKWGALMKHQPKK